MNLLRIRRYSVAGGNYMILNGRPALPGVFACEFRHSRERVLFVWLAFLGATTGATAQTFTATLSNVNLYEGSSASGSFDFTAAGVISNSSVVLSYPALNYTAALADNQDSHINVQSGFV